MLTYFFSNFQYLNIIIKASVLWLHLKDHSVAVWCLLVGKAGAYK